jgi:hypothetical protein
MKAHPYLKHFLQAFLVLEFLVLTISGFPKFRIPRISGFQEFPDTQNFRIPRISRYPEFPDTQNFQIPRISRYPEFPDSQHFQIPRITGFQEYPDDLAIWRLRLREE